MIEMNTMNTEQYSVYTCEEKENLLMKETPHKLVSRYLEMKTTTNMAMRKNQRMRPSPPLPGISATPRHC